MIQDTIQRFLIFKLQEQTFAVPLQQVREALNFPKITPFPGSPNYFLGMTDLRGQVIPVYDLRLKFGYQKKMDDDTAMVIASIGDHLAGLIVCQIFGVEALEKNQVGSPPQDPSRPSPAWITGVYQKNESLILIADLNLVFGGSLVRDQKTAG